LYYSSQNFLSTERITLYEKGDYLSIDFTSIDDVTFFSDSIIIESTGQSRFLVLKNQLTQERLFKVSRVNAFRSDLHRMLVIKENLSVALPPTLDVYLGDVKLEKTSPRQFIVPARLVGTTSSCRVVFVQSKITYNVGMLSINEDDIEVVMNVVDEWGRYYLPLPKTELYNFGDSLKFKLGVESKTLYKATRGVIKG
jgi:hypothetical protein